MLGNGKLDNIVVHPARSPKPARAVPVTFHLAILPIAQILVSHTILALHISKRDTWAAKIWRDWPGSWILCASPFGRWIVGTLNSGIPTGVEPTS